MARGISKAETYLNAFSKPKKCVLESWKPNYSIFGAISPVGTALSSTNPGPNAFSRRWNMLGRWLRELDLGLETWATGTSKAEITLKACPSLEKCCGKPNYSIDSTIFKFTDALSSKFVEPMANRNTFSRPWKMHVGLVGGFGSSIWVRRLGPGHQQN